MSLKVFSARLGQTAPVLRAVLLLVIVLGLPMGAQARDAFDRALAATLIVLGEGETPLGSAVLLEDGIVLSVPDVIGGRGRVGLRLGDGTAHVATVVARDGARGIVVLRIDGAPPAGGFSFGAVVGAGQAVFATGAPLGHGPMLTRGIIAGPREQPDPSVPVYGLRHDALLHAGFEGGALVDSEGRLVGLNRAEGPAALPGFALAIDGADLARLVPLMLAGTLRDVPDLGLTLRRVTGPVAAALGIPETGLLVESVAPRSRAERAGLVAGDILLRHDGQELTSVGALAFMIDGRGTDRVPLDVRRGDERLSVTLDLAVRSARLGTLGPALATVARIESYSFASLGVVFQDEARVAHVSTHSPAYVAGLRPGDRVLAVNGAPVDRAALEHLSLTEPLLLLVSRGGATVHVLVDPWSAAATTGLRHSANLLDAAPHLF